MLSQVSLALSLSSLILKPTYKYDRDPLNEDEDEIEDVLKTPEGGRKHLDWAAEMDDERYVSHGQKE